MHIPSVGEWALGAVLLHVHAKEAHIHAVNLLKGEKCFGSVGKRLRHLTRVHKPVTKTNKHTRDELEHYIWLLGYCLPTHWCVCVCDMMLNIKLTT